MILFSESNNYRRIARILNKNFSVNISYQLIVYWVQKKVFEMPEKTYNNRISSDIAIIEIYELYTFLKTKAKMMDLDRSGQKIACACFLD